MFQKQWKISFCIRATTAQLYQKLYLSFGSMALINMQTIVVYSITILITGFMNY